MNCSVNQNDADYFWMRDEEAVSFSDPLKTILPTGSLQVTVPAVRQSTDTTSGSYQCHATVNENTIVSQVGNVQIASLTISGSSSNKNADVGDTVILQCEVLSHPKPTINWIKSGTIVDPEQSDAFARFAILPSGNLEIRDVHTSDSGVYHCQAENSMAGISKTGSDITLTVNDDGIPPVEDLSFIVSPPRNVFVNLGDSIVLEVAVDGPATFTWFKKNEELLLQFDNHYSLVGQGNLRIQNAVELDTGLYRVRASNNLGDVEAEIQVTVRVPPRFVKRPQSAYAREGLSTQFECSWYSVPRPTITWLMDGDPIPKENAFRIERNGEVGETLRIIGVKQSDSKYYQCIVSNEVGNINAVAQLIVVPTGVPIPSIPLPFISTTARVNVPTTSPQNAGPTAAPGAPVPSVPESVVETLVSTREISLGWRSPRNPNGNILTYTVRIGEPGKDRPRIINTTAPALTSATIKDLIPDTLYEYSVCAWNSHGRGECTTTATVKTQQELLPPSEPMNLAVYILSSTSARLTWTSSEVGANTVNKYKIYFRTTDNQEPPNVRETTNVQDLTYDILGLRPNTNYTFYIGAMNVHGEGLPSAEVTRRTYSDVPSEAPSGITIEAISHSEAISPSELMVYWVPPPPETTNGEITGYRLRYRKTQNSGGANTVSVTVVSQHRLGDLDPDTEYEIKLLAENNNGSGPYSNWVTGRTLPVSLVTDAPDESRVPPEPSSITCYKYPNSIAVWWSPPLDKSIKVSGYILGYGPNIPDVEMKKLSSDSRHYVIENLEPASSYIIKLRAVNKAGEGKSIYEIIDQHSESTCVCYNWLHSLPKNATFRPRCCDNGDFKALQCYNPNDCWCFDAKGTEVKGSRGPQTKTEEDCNRPEACLMTRTVDCGGPITPTDAPKLKTPLNVRAQALSESVIMVEWQGDTRFTYTVRYKANFSSSRYKFINTSYFSLNVPELKPDTMYIFDVMANEGRRSSDYSIEASAKTKDATPTSPPMNVNVVPVPNSPTTMQVNWLPPSQPNGLITGYVVYYSTNGDLKPNKWSKEFVDGDGMTTLIQPLTCKTMYYFMMLAKNRKGEGPLSPKTSVMTPECEPTAAITNDNRQTTVDTVTQAAIKSGNVDEATIPRWLWFLIIGIAFLILFLAILLILCIACGCCVCCADLCPCFASCCAGCRSCWAECCPCCCAAEDKSMTKVMYQKPPSGDGPDVVFNIRNKPLGEMLPLRSDTEIDESAFIASETKGALEAAYTGMLLNGGIKSSKSGSVTSDQATFSSDGHLRSGGGHTGTWSSSHGYWSAYPQSTPTTNSRCAPSSLPPPHPIYCPPSSGYGSLNEPRVKALSTAHADMEMETATTNHVTSSHVSNGSAKTEFIPLQALSGKIIGMSDIDVESVASTDRQSTIQQSAVSTPPVAVTSYVSEPGSAAFTVAYEESTTHHSVERTVPMSDGSHVKTTSSHKSFEKSYTTSDRNNDDVIPSILASGFANQPLAIEVPGSPVQTAPTLAITAPPYATVDRSGSHGTGSATVRPIIQSVQDIPSTLQMNGTIDRNRTDLNMATTIRLGTSDRLHAPQKIGVGRSMGDLSINSDRLGGSFHDGRKMNISKARSFMHIAGPPSRYHSGMSSSYTGANTMSRLSDNRSGATSLESARFGLSTVPNARLLRRPVHTQQNGDIHRDGDLKGIDPLSEDQMSDTLSGLNEGLSSLTSHLHAETREPVVQRSGAIPIPSRRLNVSSENDQEFSQSMPSGYSYGSHSHSMGQSGDHFMSSYRRSETNERDAGFSYSSNNNNSCGTQLTMSGDLIDQSGYQSESNLSQDESNAHQPPTPHVSTHPLSSFSVPGPPPHYGTLPKSPPAQPRVKISAPSYSLLKRQQQAVNRNRSHPLPVVTPRAPDVTYRTVEAASPGSSTARSFSTEDLNAEMLNLEGLMKDLNAITQSDIDC
ncbi:neogenin-like isoform X4 [Anneissia japonica]|uniref:neogenin-like isoform X3 n=1 Tax=Anneissia japonica TaxID=1529436 RepID=UPI00142598DE|nr:neogenin-like isoform X3 [Anneissia japonica]XP_033096451.1 neogenin-like isoform X4 [Anneissia japonica]